MKKRIFSIILVMTMIMTFGFSGCGKSDSKDDPNLGLYEAQSCEMSGITIDVEDYFGEGFTIDLKAKGKCELVVDGVKAKGKWTLDGKDFSVSGGGFDCDGTLSNGVMKLEDVLGTGMTPTLVNEDYEGGNLADKLGSKLGKKDDNSDGDDNGNEGDTQDNDQTINQASVDEGPKDRRTEIQKYWNGDWYGYLQMYDATGDYKGAKGNTYDAFGRVEIDENGDGFLTLWYGYDNLYTYDNPAGKIKINVSYEAGFGSHGTAISVGGWMFANEESGWIEEMDIVIDPDESDYPDTMYFSGVYEDDGGSITYIYALRPWGHRWEDVIANDKITINATIHAFYEWYIPLIDEGWAMPDGYSLAPTKTMEEREEELIAAAARQSIPEGSSSGSSAGTGSEGSSSGGTGGSDVNIGNAKVTGKPYTWGNITANVPDGMTATNGGIADKSDENSLWIQNGGSYLLITLCDEEKAKSDVSTTKNMNSGEDASVTINGTTWKGTYYEYSGNPCWQIYATVDGNCFEVMSYNYSFDSVEAQTVLSTLKHS